MKILCFTCLFFLMQIYSHAKEKDPPQDKTNMDLKQVASDFADSSLALLTRVKALKILFEQQLRPDATLDEAAKIFKLATWIKKEDWVLVRAMSGPWPFNSKKAKADETVVVAIKMRSVGFSMSNNLWLALPVGYNISELDIEMILSGKCPERLKKVRMLDSYFEVYT